MAGCYEEIISWGVNRVMGRYKLLGAWLLGGARALGAYATK